MLYTQNGGFTPLMNDEWDEDILKFETENEAREFAGKTGYGEAFGFEVFHIHEGL